MLLKKIEKINFYSTNHYIMYAFFIKDKHSRALEN